MCVGHTGSDTSPSALGSAFKRGFTGVRESTAVDRQPHDTPISFKAHDRSVS